MTPEHPGDDALSALLDGEATPEEAAHVESCVACGARTDELRRAADLIGAPVPALDEARRETAIAAALDARVLPIERRRRRPVPGWLVGAAAALVLGLGLLPLAGGDSDQGDSDASGTAAPSEESAPEAVADGADDEAATMLAPAPLDAGDLGMIDGAEVGERVTAALRGPMADASGEGAADPTTTTATARMVPQCEEAVRAADPDAGILRLVARATVDGRPAEILAFEAVGSERPELWVYVVADGDCGDVLRRESVPAP